MRRSVFIGLAVLLLAACGEQPRAEGDSALRGPGMDLDASADITPGSEVVGPVAASVAAREHLIGAVVGSEDVGSQTIAAIQSLAASDAAADRMFAGEHLLLLGIDLDHAVIRDFVRTLSLEGAKPEFAAYALLVQAELSADAAERSRLLRSSDQKWPTAFSENIARLRLRYFQLVPGARVEPVEFRTASGTLSIGEGRVLMFFSLLGCGPCRAGYAAISQGIRDSGEPPRIVLCLDGTPEQVATALGENTFPHELVASSSTTPAVRAAFGVDRYPLYFVLDGGVVTYRGNDPVAALSGALEK
ncbi:MAG: hypothetical protein AB7T63_17425 [Planctomycetota bacterium]